MEAMELFARKMKVQGYTVLEVGMPGILMLYRFQRYVFQGILCVNMETNPELQEFQMEELRRRIRRDLESVPCRVPGLGEAPIFEDIRLFTLVFSKDMERGSRLTRNNSLSWLVNTDTYQLIIYEHQGRDFSHIREPLEEVLGELGRQREAQYRTSHKKGVSSLLYRKNGKQRAFVNGILVGINVLIFLVLEAVGDTTDATYLLACGGNYPGQILYYQEYWRFFTQMFIHGGVNHLFNNMLTLFFLGDNLERAVGHWKYLVIYLTSGLAASYLSFITQVNDSSWAVSVGASGAIFGILGGLVYMLLKNKGRMEELRLPQMLLYVLLTLYSGFTSVGIDNAAHIGGLIAGFLITALIMIFKTNKRREFV